MTSSIRIDADALLRKLTSLQQLRHVKAALKAAGVYVKGKAATYPASRHGPAIPAASTWSDKQRRGFFAKLKSGEIDIPYRRGASAGSERLGARWTMATRNAGMTAVIGNNASYARLVQDPQGQTAYHRMTGWQTTDDVIDEAEPVVVEYIMDAIERSIAE